MPIQEWYQQCKSCDGTGLYVGMAERNGAAVVCNSCKGTGGQHMRNEYQDFTGRKIHNAVKWVYSVNPGIGVDATGIVQGGVPVAEWLHDPNSVNLPGREMRDHTCPAWWYQTSNYSKKPNWKECLSVGIFSKCPLFKDKTTCWKRWDKENT